jgi:uncharacterized protein (TIGR03118 family)
MFHDKRRFKPTLEFLEDRYLLSGNVVQTNIVSDGFVAAKHTDSNLLNAWGIAYQPGGPFWVSDNNSGQSTFFDFNGTPAGAAVAIPLPSNTSTGTAAPTGIVYNGTSDFLLNSSPGSSAIFIFATEDGTISGWNPSVNPTKAILKVDNAAFPTSGAVYKGLAIGNNGSGNFLYAANFATGKIDVFNRSFVLTALTGSFTDPDPSHDLVGYAPFNIQNLGGQLYVTYAKQDAAHRNDVGGPGNGFVDVFDLNGNFVRRVTSHGTLNSPWGVALAPNSFSPFPGDLLVGNFRDGTINAFNPSTGAFLGQLLDNGNQPIVIHGLWGLIFGNGGAGGPVSTLYFSSGPNSEADGLFGSLTATDSSQSTVIVTPGTIPAGGTASVTLTAKDATGAQENSGGLTVAFALGAGAATGTFSSVTDNNNGTYTATFTAGTVIGNNTITATIDGQAVTTAAPTVTVQPSFSLSASTVSVSPASVQAESAATVTLTARDANGRQEPSGGLVVNFGLGSGDGTGRFSAVTDNGNGTYTAMFTGTTAGGRVITATIGGQAVTSTLPTVTITPGPASLATSFVSVSSSTIPVSGTTTVTLTARDTDGNQEASGGLTVVFGQGAGSGSGTISTVTDHGNGTYTATFTATAAGSITVTATLGGQSITSTPPAITVTLIGPSGPIATDMPTFVWSAVTGAATYDLWISDLSTGQSPALLLTNLSGTTVTLSAAQALTPGDSFRWWTRGLNGSGTPFAWGMPTDFSIAPLGTPTPAGPRGTLTSDQPAFSWSAVGLAARYDVWVSDLTTGVGGVVGSSTTTSFADTAGLTPGHSFRWWVRADSTNGSAGAWSVPTEFAISALGTPTPAGPSGTLTSDQPTFNWSAVGLSAHYDVWVSDLTTGVGGVVGSSTTTSFADTAGLTPGHSFRWWVRADSTSGSAGSWSASTDFAIAALGTPTPSGPSGTLTSDQPTFSWSAVGLAARYDVWVSDLTTGVGGVVGSSTTTSFADTAGLTPGHSFRWWVRADSANGSAGSWSVPTDFAIAALGTPTPSGPSGTLTTSQPTYTWSAVVQANRYDVWLTDLTTGVGGIIGTSASTSLAAPTPLQSGHSYRWWVRAVSTNGTAGSWSVPTDFFSY